MTTGEGVGSPVQSYGETGRLQGASEAGVKGSGDTGMSHGMRVGAAPAGTEICGKKTDDEAGPREREKLIWSEEEGEEEEEEEEEQCEES